MKLEYYQNKDVNTVVKEAMDKATASQDVLNAVVSFANVEEQLENLKEIDKNAPFYGVPIVVKDNVSTKGIRTTASSRILDNYVPFFNAHVIDKLQKAGAVIVAKSSMDELGMGGTNLNAYTGKVNNPWDTSRISGGSSGGSAVLVAAGVVPFALGTDTGDSIRKPASFCGVVGVKPTYGRISRYGVIPYSSSLDHVGYFTINVFDAAKALEVVAGRDDRDMTSSNKPVEAYASLLHKDVNGKRIAILKNVQDSITCKEITNSFNTIVSALQEKGAIVEEVMFDEDLMNTLLPTYYVIANAEATANHSNLDGIRFGMREEGKDLEEIMTNSRTKGFSSSVRKRFVIGSYSLFEENQEKLFRKAQRVRRVIVDALKETLSHYDAIIANASGGVAPTPEASVGDELSATYMISENHMLLGNFSGYPSMTVPATFVNGLPVGINIMCKPFCESEMFNIAYAIEDITGLKDVCAEVKK